jgi:transcriptional regulator with XRE-family HTH domain
MLTQVTPAGELFGARLRELRNKRSMTQVEAYVGAFEVEGQPLTAAEIDEIARQMQDAVRAQLTSSTLR